MPHTRTRTIVAANVKRFREERDIPVPVAAKRLGVGRQYWYRIEAGDGNIPLDRLDKLAVILDVSVIDLLTERKNGNGAKR